MESEVAYGGIAQARVIIQEKDRYREGPGCGKQPGPSLLWVATHAVKYFTPLVNSGWSLSPGTLTKVPSVYRSE